MSFVNDGPRVMASDSASPSPSGAPPVDLGRLIGEVRGLAHDHLELATLETRLSVNTLIRTGMIAIFTGLALVTAWLGVLGAAALGLMRFGVAPVVAMLVLAAANLLAAGIGWVWMKRLSQWLGWPATQRAIKSAPSSDGKRDPA
jgi:uncharacterized membrane protein YqjE